MAEKYENLKHWTYTIADSTAAAVKTVWAVPYKICIYRVQVTVTTTEATACVISFNHHASIGGAAGAAELGYITLPAANKIGNCYYDLVARNMILSPGEGIEVEVVTGSTGDKGAICEIVYDYIPEVEGNIAAMVETA